MAGYFLAPSLVSLRNEINAAHPGRDKSSDGWIGDAAHNARKSDHNPDYAAGGIVRAIDVDKDGIDTNRLLAVATANPRVEYVIWNRGIYTRQNGFRRANYTGSNPHDKHMHISIRPTAAGAAAGGWGYSGGAAPTPAPGSAPWGSGKPVNVVAQEVIRGEWGSGTDRANRLRTALYNPDVIQAEVNRILKGGAAPAPAPAPPAPWGSGKPVDVVAREVLRGEWGSGVDRQNRLRAALYNPDVIQAAVNAIVAGRPVPAAPAPPPPARKSNEQIAAEVKRGEWGNNPQRGQRLQAAGYNPTEIQRIINGGGGAPAPVRLSISALAQQVIAGQWGNGTERESRITKAGYDYAAVRAEVNRRL